MRATGYLAVAAIFVAVALVAYVTIRAINWNATDFSLVVAAILGSQLGAVIWHRQAPETRERSVKLGLGAVLSPTAVAFALVFQATSNWLERPEVTVPIAAIGCFFF